MHQKKHGMSAQRYSFLGADTLTNSLRPNVSFSYKTGIFLSKTTLKILDSSYKMDLISGVASGGGKPIL